jgi:multicomponent Na+:H+ antiporter subunit C
MVDRVTGSLNYLMPMLLFAVGMYIMLARSNLIKKVIGLNIMETAIFLFLISLGYVHQGIPPIDPSTDVARYTNPLPEALVLTGIVIAISTSAFALSLVVRIYNRFGTLDADELVRRTRRT